ncbi:MAG: tail fiber domain-containing protein [Candidatus Omnitrophica bacterium]|nr:tail fiber domain-containing protein [Candidatus Omnitrophota bacterium]
MNQARIAIFVISIMAIPVFALAETLTMTTYYPSPFGVYQSLRLAPNASAPACSGSTTGTMYVDTSNILQYCDGTSYSTIGEWILSGTDLYPRSYEDANVGIGTNEPDAKLHIFSDTDPTAIRIQTGLLPSWELQANDTNPQKGFSIWSESVGTVLSILPASGGLVGIQTTTPSSALEVNGDIELEDNLIFNGVTPMISTTQADLSVVPSSGFSLRADLSGRGRFYVYDGDVGDHLLTVDQTTRRVGILNEAPTSELDVNGTVTAISYLYASDARFKEDFKPVLGLDGIMQLEGLSYTWKENGKHDIGITAQDVEKVYPELVYTDEKSGKKYVEYGNLIAPMIEAIKDQQKLIEYQNAEIDALRKEFHQMKHDMDFLR